MNAFEIIKNIIPDGITQCKETIGERLRIPDFNEPEPQDDITSIGTDEEWLDLEIRKLRSSDFYYEGEYYGLNSLMSIGDYNESYIPTVVASRFSNYNSYKSVWNLYHSKLVMIETTRNEIHSLVDGDLLEIEKYDKLILKQQTVNCIFNLFGTPKNLYEAYCSLWRNTRDPADREKILISCEERWYYFVYNFNGSNIPATRVYEYKQKFYFLKQNYTELYKELTNDFLHKFNEWKIRKLDHIDEQTIRVEEINRIEDGYYQRNTGFINSLYTDILKGSKYNFEFLKDIDVDFNYGNKLLMVEYTLPSIENLPTIKEIKYLSSKGEYRNIPISQSDLLKLFDEAVYSICLRSIYEIFKNDPIEVINAVNFNGWIKSINKATGKEENTCIISIQVQRKEFMDIELDKVDPKTCFKHFKGVGSSKLFGITAIQPILQIQRNDRRFVNSHSVEFDDSTNLAAMAWEDFEHLIRELFEKEFSSNGGEVKVTQASRDGGVDAIAFDPDPIRGGKIVIQAKRYTNTVGVSAVRDLFGTVMNEGANKGILVTTSDYGPDSYEFAKGKPITLLNGANLLYLLENHGTRAKIDIKEARRLMNEEKY